jgi:hypothetical protein
MAETTEPREEFATELPSRYLPQVKYRDLPEPRSLRNYMEILQLSDTPAPLGMYAAIVTRGRRGVSHTRLEERSGGCDGSSLCWR